MTMTKTFSRLAAQGDVFFIKHNSLPSSGLKGINPVNGHIVIAHSETGHNHAFAVLDRVDTKPAVEFFSTDNPLISWLKVNRPTALEHHRPHDTHTPIMFDKGIYEVRRQREYTPEGWRQVAD